MKALRGSRALACGVLVAAVAAPAGANPASVALRAKAAAATYNLDHDVAMATFKEAVAADPNDSAAHRGLATSLWLSITFRRGNMTVDDYLGRPNRPSNAPLPNPPPETVAAFRDAIEQAIAIARKRIAINPKDADAHAAEARVTSLRKRRDHKYESCNYRRRRIGGFLHGLCLTNGPRGARNCAVGCQRRHGGWPGARSLARFRTGCRPGNYRGRI
jgi:tetratricopeptide (TPR) repeat protein